MILITNTIYFLPGSHLKRKQLAVSIIFGMIACNANNYIVGDRKLMKG